MGQGILGIGGKDTTKTNVTSYSTDQRKTASGSGIVQEGGALGEGAISGKQIAQDGSVIIRGGKGALTVNTLDAEFAKSALSSVGDLSRQQTNTLGQVLTEISSLAESKQTEGEAGRNKIMMWVALAALAVVAIMFWRQR